MTVRSRKQHVRAKAKKRPGERHTTAGVSCHFRVPVWSFRHTVQAPIKGFENVEIRGDVEGDAFVVSFLGTEARFHGMRVAGDSSRLLIDNEADLATSTNFRVLICAEFEEPMSEDSPSTYGTEIRCYVPQGERQAFPQQSVSVYLNRYGVVDGSSASLPAQPEKSKKNMNTYLVHLECFFPEKHRSQELELFVSVNAESPEDIEAPLREALIKAQAETGFNEVFIAFIAMVPSEPSVMFAFQRSKASDTVTVETDTEWLEPAWLLALETPNSPEEDAEVRARHVAFASELGRPPPEWDGKESLGGSWSPFMVFPDATVHPDHAADPEPAPN